MQTICDCLYIVYWWYQGLHWIAIIIKYIINTTEVVWECCLAAGVCVCVSVQNVQYLYQCMHSLHYNCIFYNYINGGILIKIVIFIAPPLDDRLCWHRVGALLCFRYATLSITAHIHAHTRTHAHTHIPSDYLHFII